MRIGTIRTAEGRAVIRVQDGFAVEIADGTLDELLAMPDWARRAAAAAGRELSLSEVDWAPLVTVPQKVICVGLNYRAHIEEMGMELPSHPTLFAKFANSLLGARDDLVLPANSAQVDWEAELGVVIGAPARHVDVRAAKAAIAGYTVCNDVSMRDWQWRTSEWLQGKAFEASTPVGPVLVTGDEVDHAADLAVSCAVDGEVVQSSRTSDLVFSPAEIVSYISQFTTLLPGDLIATGTPSGVGAATQRFLAPGEVLSTAVEGIGECVNPCVPEKTG